ncbi:MAG: hypothetical protein LBT21_04980 [Oscillospiraceae bacterium]|jgi:hypothetical protein|nr:hypothetical protein [Oscillospiraceae bacterium]
MKQTRKILSVLLAVTLIFGSIAVSAFAFSEDTVVYVSRMTWIGSNGSGESVELTIYCQPALDAAEKAAAVYSWSIKDADGNDFRPGVYIAGGSLYWGLFPYATYSAVCTVTLNGVSVASAPLTFTTFPPPDLDPLTQARNDATSFNPIIFYLRYTRASIDAYFKQVDMAYNFGSAMPTNDEYIAIAVEDIKAAKSLLVENSGLLKIIADAAETFFGAVSKVTGFLGNLFN